MTSGLKHKLDYDDLQAIPPDRLRYELAEGDLHVTPAPSPQHQWTGKQLQRQLEAYFEGRNLGHVYDAPIDVVLSRQDVFEPDLVVVTDPSIVTSRAIEGVPTLVVEVLSASTASYDRTTKSRRYAEFGIDHFWIVDIRNSTLECYRRTTRGRYDILARLEGDTTWEHPDFPGLMISTAPLWTKV